MAYTIIEVERATNIPSRKIRFWLDKGLFPFIERDENGVRYFAKVGLQSVMMCLSPQRYVSPQSITTLTPIIAR